MNYVSRMAKGGMSLFLLSMTLLCAGPLKAKPGPTILQGLVDTRITISFAGDRLDSSFAKIHAISGVEFAFDPDELKVYRAGTFRFHKTTLDIILTRLLKETDLHYKEMGHYIVIYKNSPEDHAGTSAPQATLARTAINDDVVLTAASINTTPEPKWYVDVSGTVTDDGGKPLAGVNVTVKGSNQGTTTDDNGVFHLKTDSYNVTLQFTFTGYDAVEMKASRAGLKVMMQVKAGNLDQVVVIGYGTQRRADVTGSISSITGNEIKNLPVTSVEDALEGKMAGVQVIRPDGSPGGNANILIRGLTSINQPGVLYIVDGVRSSGDNFNMQDVASVDVLKDASAAAIYGASAAGGVIIITTKKGSAGKPTIHFTMRDGSVHPQVENLLGRDQFVALEQFYNPQYLQGVNIASLPNTNWTKALYSNGQDQNYDLSISGSGPSSNYLLSGFYNAQKGVYIDNSSYLAGVRLNSDYKVTSGIKVGEQVYMTVQNQNLTNANPPPNPPFRTQPIMAVYDSSGNFAKTPAGFEGGNPVGSELTNPNVRRSYNIQSNAYAEIKLPLWLSFRATVSYSYNSSAQNNFQETYNFGANVDATNTLEKSSSWVETLLDNGVLTFDHSFGKHSLNILAGYEQQKQTTDGTDVLENNQAVQPNSSFFPTSATTVTVNPNNNVQDANGLIRSEFGRLNYNYDGRYYLSGAIRRDGNFQVFGPNYRYGVFPSINGGWRISEEPFFQRHVPIVNQLMLRASYGVLGNSNINGYQFLSDYANINAQDFTDQGTRYLGYGFNNLPNADIRWESLYETNIGADIALLNNHLYGTLEWYNKTTKNVLYNVPLPLSAGVGNTYLANVGTINNKGFEITLGYRDHVGNLGYNLSWNGAFNRNEVVSLYGTSNNPILDGGNDIGGGYGVMNGYSLSITQPGHPFAQFYGYKALGIYKTTQQISSNTQFSGQSANLGDLIFADVNHMGHLNDSDRTTIGNPNPKLIYGFNIQLNWKGFDLSAVLSGVLGVQIFNGLRPYEQYLFNDGNTTSRILKDSYVLGNGLTNQPRTGVFETSGGTTSYVADPNGNYTRPSSYYVEPGGYMKLKNLQIGYTFNAKALRLSHIDNLRVFVMGNNLFTVTRYSGLDPELSGSSTARGIDNPNQYPHTRIFSGGLSVGF